MAHEHRHAHAHGGTDHAGGASNLRLAFFFNLVFTLIEVAGGFWTQSMAVLSDALHDLGDSLVLGAAWYLSNLAVRGRDGKYSYGYGRYSMLGGWLTALVLAIGSLVLMVFTLSKIGGPHEPHAKGMMLLAVFGLTMNGIAAWRLHGGHSLNEQGAFLHLMEDVLGWAAVLVGAVIIHFTGLGIVDPLLSVAINVFVLFNAVKTLRKGTGILMQRLPEGFDEEAITTALQGLPHVVGSHDQHAWTLDGEYVVLTVHLEVDTTDADERSGLTATAREMLQGMGVHHATIELEQPKDSCALHDH
ncbi:MAG TPA: cation diffusion facilitator family transporter [Flavobacteriales bacterium]|nr:cation diffusion facilitator family transporter [Flavobacteriales bacterium]HRO40456.1 cation diffusion facilitator family transporter [Flavobacteriales bacterium]HRP82391.1 cation diffusion facilitator family transporter [Flavobacteriales bacterium]HRQ84606.1 cation diffusion facilitator family transporter [Flavobacteriales bacterium]